MLRKKDLLEFRISTKKTEVIKMVSMWKSQGLGRSLLFNKGKEI